MATRESKLLARIEELEKIIQEQASLINEYQNNYVMNMFNSLNTICEKFGALLNPIPISLNASYKGKSERYEVNIENILCVVSEGRSKFILLRRPIIGIGNNVRETKVICCNYNMDELINLFNRVNINFFEVNRSVLVNLKHYGINQNQLQCTMDLPEGYQRYFKIKLNKEKLSHFVNRKGNYKSIYSLHKYLLRYKLQNGLPI